MTFIAFSDSYFNGEMCDRLIKSVIWCILLGLLLSQNMVFVEFRIQTSYRMCSCIHETKYLTARLSLAFPNH
jgi:hypothetical protein